MQKNSYQGQVIDIWIEQGLMYAVYKVKDIDVSVAKKAVEERLQYLKGESYAGIIDYTLVQSTTKEARNYFATAQAAQNVKALAIITGSYLNKLLVSFYLNINKPPFPIALFTDKEQALEWVKKYR